MVTNSSPEFLTANLCTLFRTHLIWLHLLLYLPPRCNVRVTRSYTAVLHVRRSMFPGVSATDLYDDPLPYPKVALEGTTFGSFRGYQWGA